MDTDMTYVLDTPDYPDVNGKHCKIVDSYVCDGKVLYDVEIEDGTIFSAYEFELIPVKDQKGE